MTIRHKSIKKSIAFLLIIGLMFGLVPLSSFGMGIMAVDPVEEPDPDTFKFMQLFSANSQRDMSYCYYTDNMTEYFAPYISGKEEAIISFTQYASQNCSLVLYEYTGDEMDQKDYYLTGHKFTFDPVKLGDERGTIVGVKMLENITEGAFVPEDPYGPDGANKKAYYDLLASDRSEEYTEAMLNAQAKVQTASAIENVYFYGMNDHSLEYYKENWETITVEPPFIRNWVYWAGAIMPTNGTGDQMQVEDGNYVVAVIPEDEYMKTHGGVSYLPIKINSTLDVDKVNSEFEFPELYCPIGGDPVSMLDGSFTWNRVDLTAEGAKPLSFERFYGSKNTDEDYGLGYGWSHSFLFKIIENRTGVIIVVPDGSNMRFTLDYDGSYISKDGSPFKLTKHGSGGFTLAKNNGEVYKFNKEGNMASYTDIAGDEIIYTYNSSDLLERVENESGAFEFAYNADNRIETVTCITEDEDGNILERENTFTYTDDGDLATSVNCEDDSLEYDYDGDHNLLSIKDFLGTLYVENIYDDQNRVVEQFVKDQDWSTFVYEEGLTTWNASNDKFMKVYYDDKLRVTAVEDNSGTEKYVYNEKNQLEEYTDTEDNTTSYIHDEQGNVIETVFGILKVVQ